MMDLTIHYFLNYTTILILTKSFRTFLHTGVIVEGKTIITHHTIHCTSRDTDSTIWYSPLTFPHSKVGIIELLHNTSLSNELILSITGEKWALSPAKNDLWGYIEIVTRITTSTLSIDASHTAKGTTQTTMRLNVEKHRYWAGFSLNTLIINC